MPTNLPALARHVANPTLRVPDGECLRRFVEYLTTCDGLPYDPYRPDIVATNGRLQTELLKVLAEKPAGR